VETTAPEKRNTHRGPQPAILTIAALFVTCPGCSNDIAISDCEVDAPDWSLAHLAEYDGETDQSVLPVCPECGQMVTINLPKSLPVNP
jgi:hypothetical protein